MTRLLAYLTEDVVRILPRWIAWLEIGLVAAVMVTAAESGFRTVLRWLI